MCDNVNLVMLRSRDSCPMVDDVTCRYGEHVTEQCDVSADDDVIGDVTSAAAAGGGGGGGECEHLTSS